MSKTSSLIHRFAAHPVAANVLMCLMLLAGALSLSQLNTQFLPNFSLDFITVQVVWPGASAEDVERSVTIPLEQALNGIYNVKEMTSISSDSSAIITLEYEEKSNMGVALDEVNQRVDGLRNLPSDSEVPIVKQVVRFENIARLVIYGPKRPAVLKDLAYQVKRDLLNRGIAKIDIEGLGEDEIVVEIPPERLFELNQTLNELTDSARLFSQDLPAGVAGRGDIGYSLRNSGERRTNEAIGAIPLNLQGNTEPVFLEDIGTVTQRPVSNAVRARYLGQPAVILNLQRTEGADSLESAKILADYLAEEAALFDDTIEFVVFDEAYEPIKERINVLLVNGFTGLLLILVVLFIVLDARLAFWVAAGIPISFMAALGILYLYGGTINMVSLFGLIMSLGIIVDDTIVVGENAFVRIAEGNDSLTAATNAAKRMFWPVIASSLTTVAAFLPLMLIGDVIGNILFDIPLVVVCVILASLVECFLVLPGHIHHSYQKVRVSKNNLFDRVRQSFDQRFTHFQRKWYRPRLRFILGQQRTILCIAGLVLLLSFSLLFKGILNFTFFPTPDSTIINANVQFVAGTPRETVESFMSDLESSLLKTDASLAESEGAPLLKSVVGFIGKSGGAGESGAATRGDHYGQLVLELSSPDERDMSNQSFINAWQKNIPLAAGLEKLSIASRRGGPPGNDIDIDIIGQSPQQLKTASLRLQQLISQYPGVYNLQDDLPYGQPQIIFSLTPEGAAAGLTDVAISRQIRAGFDGQILQILSRFEEELEVRLMLPEASRDQLATLDTFPIKTPEGTMVPLSSVAHFTYQQGLDTLRHSNGQLSARVSAEVNTEINNAQTILSDLQTALPEISQTYQVDFIFKGRSEDQATTFSDMKRGLVLALSLIYLILAFMFGSYTWPFVVMAIIPFGVAGALFGHWLMGIDVTLLSLFGIFGLSGIAVNDSIILVTFYQSCLKKGLSKRAALIEASTIRLRPVVLTSTTTIAGLLPLLFEKSVQAQFLIPMAVSLAFGLIFVTVWVLILIPILLSRLATPEHALTD